MGRENGAGGVGVQQTLGVTGVGAVYLDVIWGKQRCICKSKHVAFLYVSYM